MKRMLSGTLAALLLIGMMLSGCASAAREDVIALLLSEENEYTALLAEGVAKSVEECGYGCEVYYPETAASEDQIKILQTLTERRVAAVIVMANDAYALNDAMLQARTAGVKVLTLGANTREESSMLFLNPAGDKAIARALLDAVYDMTDGAGEWAIVSTSTLAPSQNDWIAMLREIMTEGQYSKLRLVDIVYGNNDYDQSARLTEQLLEDYPDLKVICAPEVVGLQAAAATVAQADADVLVTGLGLPSQMADYIGEENICPYLYLWDVNGLSEVAAHAAAALVTGEITGKAGERFSAGNVGEFEITQGDYGGAEVIFSRPLKISETNLDVWRHQI